MSARLFTSESVTEGHPDKICDAISDGVLDALLAEDPDSRVAVETMVTTGQVHVAGEVTTRGYADIPAIVRDTVLSIGYDSSAKGFDGASCGVNVAIGAQSPDIAQGVDEAWEARQDGDGRGETDGNASGGADGGTAGSAHGGTDGGADRRPGGLARGDDDEIERQGAGDQGLMFGYACSDTPELMPLPIALAHRLSRRLTAVRKSGRLPYLRPDGKTQVTIEYVGDRALRLDAVVVSSQHAEDINLATMLTPDVRDQVVEPELAELDIDTRDFDLYVNPTGRFVLGGPMGDAGLTGRKVIVDTYGGIARHGGGAFSGKDPSKVDRSGAYAMRWVAKNAVAAGLAERLEVQVAYAIGKAHPVGLFVETFGTELVDPEKIAGAIRDVFDLRPGAIVRDLDLKRPIYQQTAAYGHFGRTDIELPWETTDRAQRLADALGL